MMRSSVSLAARFRRDLRGAAAAEFAIWLFFLVPAILNIIDLGVYVFRRMQVDSAAQAAVQAAFTNCNISAGSSSGSTCPNMSGAIARAIASTSLGSSVTQQSINEGNYCADATNNVLNSCSTTGAGHYIYITVQYTNEPVFPGVTVASILPSTITRTAWTRLY